MLLALGVRRIRLLSNNPDKQTQLQGYGIEVVALEPTGFHESPHNVRYLNAKRDQAGHLL
jgi:GTP cyclohydrolase II